MENQKNQKIFKSSVIILGIALIFIIAILSDWEHFKQGLMGSEYLS